MDLESRARWVDYSRAKDVMFAHTDIAQSPWYVVEADDKRRARLNCIAHLLSRDPLRGPDPAPVELPPRQSEDGYRRPDRGDAEVRARSRRSSRLRSFANVAGARGGVLVRVLADERLPRRGERDRDPGRDPRRPAGAGDRCSPPVFNMLGALLVGTAVADTIAGIVTVAAARGGRRHRRRGAGGATPGTSLTWWRGLPSSSGHALVGGLVGAALVEGGIGARQLGRPRRLAAGRRLRRPDRARRLARDRVRLRVRARRARLRRALRRARAACASRCAPGEWAMSAALSSATAPTTRRRRWA